MDELRQWAEKQVEALEDKSPLALELARFISPAIRIEPELLRALRLAILPGAGPWVESELWFSTLVHSRSAAGIGLDPAVVEILREKLAELWRDTAEQPRITFARAVMEEVHRDLSPALALEERVAWSAVEGDLDEINLEIASAVKAMTLSDRKGLNAWASQALGRLPPAAFATEAGQTLRYLALQTAAGSGKPVASDQNDPVSLLAELRMVRLGVRRSGGLLELGSLSPHARQVVPLPDTEPRLVEVIWNEGGVERMVRKPVPKSGNELVQVGISSVRIRNALRQEFQVPPFGRWSGPTANWVTIQSRSDKEGMITISVVDRTSNSYREEKSLLPSQVSLLDNFLNERLNSGQLDSEAGLVLTEMIFSLASLTKMGHDFILFLNSQTEILPWELIRLSKDDEESALGLFGRLVRRSSTVELKQRSVSRQAPENAFPEAENRLPTTLVLSAGSSTPGTWGAAMRQEAEQAQRLMQGAGFSVTARFEGTPRDILVEIHSHQVRVLHLGGPVTARANGDFSEGISRFKSLEINEYQGRRGGVERVGIDLGDGVTLTPGDIEQMRVLPELVVLHAVPGETGEGRQPSLLTPAFAAEWGRTLEQYGVSGVVVNGWAVEPEPASLFVLAFYSAMLEGSTLAEAGLLARRETKRAYPASTVWAAFQIHGDPDFILQKPAMVSRKIEKGDEPSDLADPSLYYLRKFEKRLVPVPGLYRVTVAYDLEMKPVSEQLPVSDQPILLLLPGASSNVNGSFGALCHGANRSAVQGIARHYNGRILAFEYWGLSLTPITNALNLAEALPHNACLHILSLSSGGLIGELLCRSERVDGPPIDETDLSLFTGEERQALERLGHILETKRFRIERFVRVACPVRGTVLFIHAYKHYGKFSRVFGLLGNIIGSSALEFIDAASDPERTPGLRALAPSSSLIAMLNRPDVIVEADLSIVAGTYRAGSLSDRLKAKMFHHLISEDNDILVPTNSMFGGSIRRAPVHYVFFEGPDINHFSYFERSEVVTTIADRLIEQGSRGIWRILADSLPIFLSYSHKDELAVKKLQDMLEPLIRESAIRLLNDKDKLAPGEEWAAALQKALTEARLVIIFVSPEFMASEYAQHELDTTLRHAKNNECRIIPILLAPTDLRNSPLIKWQFVPRDGVPIVDREDRNQAWQEVAEAVRQAVYENIKFTAR